MQIPHAATMVGAVAEIRERAAIAALPRAALAILHGQPKTNEGQESMSRTVEIGGRSIPLEGQIVDLAAQMRAQHGVAEPQAVAPGQMLAANMRARHGIADHQPQAKADPGAPRFDIVADMKRRHGITD